MPADEQLAREPVIVFLRPGDQFFEFTTDGAYEAITREAEVRRLIAANPFLDLP